MTTVTPIYSRGIWGSVVAVEVDGVIVRPGDRGQAVREEVTHTFEKEGCLPETITLPIFFKSIPPWELLESAGLLPDLTPIPEPEELQLAREKQAALDRLHQSFHDWTAAGWDTGLGFRVPLEWSSPILQQLRETAATYQQLIMQGAKSINDLIPIKEMNGAVQLVTAGSLLAKAGELTLIRQTAVDRYTLAESEIAAIESIEIAQDWQPPAWEST